MSLSVLLFIIYAILKIVVEFLSKDMNYMKLINFSYEIV